jgi:hypothetical protein
MLIVGEQRNVNERKKKKMMRKKNAENGMMNR